MKFFSISKKNGALDKKNNGYGDSPEKNTYANGNYQTNSNKSFFNIYYQKVHSNKTKDKLEKLQNYSYPYSAKARLKEKFPFTYMDEEDIDLSIIEFKKYAGLRIIKRYEKNSPYKDKAFFAAASTLAMTSEIMDEVWHNLILFTKEYYEFSMLVYGEYLHHLPAVAGYSSPITNNDVKVFINAYKEYFGPINSIWYYKINKNEKNDYKQSTFRSNINHDNDNGAYTNSTDGDSFSFAHGDSQQGYYPHSQSGNMFARIDASTFLYYLSMDSVIYSIDAGLQMLDLDGGGGGDGDNYVSAYVNEASDSSGCDSSGSDSSCSGCGCGCGG